MHKAQVTTTVSTLASASGRCSADCSSSRTGKGSQPASAPRLVQEIGGRVDALQLAHLAAVERQVGARTDADLQHAAGRTSRPPAAAAAEAARRAIARWIRRGTTNEA